MSYGIIYGEGALDALGELGLPELIEPFEAAMNRLANDLVGLGQKSSFPYPLGQQFSFSCPAGP